MSRGVKYYDANEKPSLPGLRSADERKFYELCEKAGYFSLAFSYYASQPERKDLEHALELAKKFKKNPLDLPEKVIYGLEAHYCRDTRAGLGSLGQEISTAADRKTIRRGYQRLKFLEKSAEELGMRRAGYGWEPAKAVL